MINNKDLCKYLDHQMPDNQTRRILRNILLLCNNSHDNDEINYIDVVINIDDDND